MAIFYLDFVNGNNANTGASWAQALATVAGVTSAKGLAPGDTVRIAKTPDKVSIGNGTWTTAPAPVSLGVTAATNATPIQITANSHGLVTGDVVTVTGVGGNIAANGTWIVTNTGINTVTLDGSVGSGTYTSGGSINNINYKTVKLATAQTKTVNNCETVFTAANGSTVTLGTTLYNKEGYGFVQVISPASTAATTRYAFQALPAATDFSAYQELSFWFNSGGFAAANSWRICLCSDTAGLTIVDTFLVPASVVQNNSNPVSLTRVGGGNLGSSIQSIAIYSGSVPINSSIMRFDNFIACTTGGLNLTGIVSPVASNTDQYDNYPIQSINDTLVIIDNVNTTVSTSGRGYYGTTQTTTTYFRQPNSNAGLYSQITNNANLITPAVLGTAALPITWSGGWNTATTTQDGMTVILAGGTNNTWQLVNYTYYENLGVLRGSASYRNSGGNYTYGWKLSNSFGIGAGQGGLNLAAAINGNNYPGQVQNCGFNNTAGIQLNSGIIQIDTVKVNNCIPFQGAITLTSTGNTSYLNNVEASNSNNHAFALQGPPGFPIKNWTAKDNNAAVINFINSGGWTFYNGTTSGNPSIDSQQNATADNFIIGLTSTSDGGPSAPNNGYANTVYVNRNGTNITWYNQKGTTTVDTGTVHGTATSSWKFTNTGSSSTGNLVLNPQIINLATVYCTANASTTISAWFNKSHATNIQASLVCPGLQIAGVPTEVSTTAVDSTGWQQVSINFTPTVSGVVTIQANFWVASTAVANTGLNCFVSDLSLPIGIANQNLSYNFMGLPWAQNAVAPSVAYAAVGL
jgi:hypothetical protein